MELIFLLLAARCKQRSKPPIFHLLCPGSKYLPCQICAFRHNNIQHFLWTCNFLWLKKILTLILFCLPRVLTEQNHHFTNSICYKVQWRQRQKYLVLSFAYELVEGFWHFIFFYWLTTPVLIPGWHSRNPLIWVMTNLSNVLLLVVDRWVSFSTANIKLYI